MARGRHSDMEVSLSMQWLISSGPLALFTTKFDKTSLISCSVIEILSKTEFVNGIKSGRSVFVVVNSRNGNKVIV